VIDYLTYYYNNGSPPFRCLSDLPDCEAIRIMEEMYVKYEGKLVFERFKDPTQYLRQRRLTEQWVRENFIAKGGRPQTEHPISMVLGKSAWIEQHAPDPVETQGEIHILLSDFKEGDVSFTFPDSMVSFWLGNEKPAEYYQPGYHGQVFTREEILSIVEEKGLSEETWEFRLPDGVGAYIEAQVWNRSSILKYKP
jgi:hypothetical protein